MDSTIWYWEGVNLAQSLVDSVASLLEPPSADPREPSCVRLGFDPDNAVRSAIDLRALRQTFLAEICAETIVDPGFPEDSLAWITGRVRQDLITPAPTFELYPAKAVTGWPMQIVTSDTAFTETRENMDDGTLRWTATPVSWTTMTVPSRTIEPSLPVSYRSQNGTPVSRGMRAQPFHFEMKGCYSVAHVVEWVIDVQHTPYPDDEGRRGPRTTAQLHHFMTGGIAPYNVVEVRGRTITGIPEIDDVEDADHCTDGKLGHTGPGHTKLD